MVQSHLTVLAASASSFASSSAFKIPQLDASGSIQGFAPITYEQFYTDVESYARYWLNTLHGVPSRSVIGLWVSGYTYRDVVHIYGLSRAGFIPQLFSIRLPNPEVIYELLADARASALVYDPSFAEILKDCPVPTHSAGLVTVQPSEIPLPDLARESDDVAFIFHTSGSTSGRPKLVPCSFNWIETVVRKSHSISRPKSARQDVTCSMGSMCHIGQTFMFIGTLQHGACVIEPTKMPFSSTELKYMIQVGGLNRLQLFAPFMSAQLKAAQTDAKLASLLANLDEVLYSGQLPREDDDWAVRNGLKLQNLFGSTECGVQMVCTAGSRQTSFLLRPIDGFTYRFVSTTSTSEGVHKSTAKLIELIIPADSPDCPHVSLRHADGDFHTGDLFQEVSSGVYIFRGRDDDWIKSENSLKIDTKSIEDNAMAMCTDLIAACVVVGAGRPSPAMFVEPISQVDPAKLRKDIVRKTRQFHSRRYLHERITSPELIFVVPQGSLPRTATKGNIRRKAVEEAYKVQLDEVYERMRS